MQLELDKPLLVELMQKRFHADAKLLECINVLLFWMKFFKKHKLDKESDACFCLSFIQTLLSPQNLLLLGL